MGARFSVVYPTRHRPEFIEQALRILEKQRHDEVEVIVCDNAVDPDLSCEQICRESTLADLHYVRPPEPLGMVDNWNHALQFATGDYVCFLTDKMFVLPGALQRVDEAIEGAHGPDLVSWTSDFYFPASYPEYFGTGTYGRVKSGVRTGEFRRFSPADELDERGAARVSRTEQSHAEYCRGKLVFGAYRREMVRQIVERYGALFHSINPDYTSMVLGLSEAQEAVEMASSCVVSMNTDISNGMLCDTDDAVALAFLNSQPGGAERTLPNMLVPAVYASLHNWVAHDYLSLKTAHDLPFGIDTANWVVYCHEDIHRPERRWSDARVEAQQKEALRSFRQSLDPPVAAAVSDRIAAREAARAKPRSGPPARGLARRLVPDAWRRRSSAPFPSIQAAVDSPFADRN